MTRITYPIWLRHGAAALLFALLTWWYFAPVLPSFATATPPHFDMANNIVELLSSMRSLVRHPLSFSAGQYAYPYPYSNALLNSNYIAGVPFYLVYCMTGNPCLAYNLLLLLFFFLNAMAVYLVVQVWTASWTAAVLAACLCAFFPHRFHELAFYHYQMTFIAALVIYVWLRFLKHGGFALLCLLFGIITLKAVSVDYNTLFLLVVLLVIVPLGLLAYPQRMKAWWQFLVLTIVVAPVMLVFAQPYYVNFQRLVPGQWTFMALDLQFITWPECLQVFQHFVEHVMHPRTRQHLAINAPIVPGAVCLSLCALAALWIPLSLFFTGRGRWLRLALLLLTVCAVLLATTPAYQPSGQLWVFSPLARLHVDPPVLALIRFPRAYLFSVMLCFSILVGLGVGDLLLALHTRPRWVRLGVTAGVWLLILAATREHAVAIAPFVNNVPRTLDGVYAWLAQQAKPSPVIEFPLPHGLASYTPVLNTILADQPTALPLGRIFTQTTFFLMEEGKEPLTQQKLAMLQASPYRFWVQHGADAHYRAQVEAQSDVRYATNFGGTYVFKNPQIERALPLSFALTQHWALSFPHIYMIEGQVTFTGLYSFVPLGERPLQIELECLDAGMKPLARLRVRGELPFMLAGPTNCFDVQLRYDPRRRRLTAEYRNSGHFNMEHWPTAHTRADAALLQTRWIRTRLAQRGTGKTATALLRVVPTPARWPLLFGNPMIMPHVAGAFGAFEREGAIPFQRSQGNTSMVMNGRPDGVATALVIVARAAVVKPPVPLVAQVLLNDLVLGTISFDAVWRTNSLPTPEDRWRDNNTIVLNYPRTYNPCLLREGYDTERRCASLASMDALTISTAAAPATLRKDSTLATVTRAAQRPPAPPPRAAHTVYAALLRNGAFQDGLTNWLPWRAANDDPAALSVIAAPHFGRALQIANPQAQLLGLQQLVSMVSGTTYRLCATARSDGKDAQHIFGGRVAVYLPPEPERELVWLYETNAWSYKECVFTCNASGVATVYLHMGYGQVAATGAFTEVMLEELRNPVHELDK